MTTSLGELLFSTNGLDWQTNQTMFSYIHDATFTPTGILIAAFSSIAEASFHPADAPEAQFGFYQLNRRFHLDAPLGYYEAQVSTNLLEWQRYRAITNGSVLFPSSSNQQFYRAIRTE